MFQIPCHSKTIKFKLKYFSLKYERRKKEEEEILKQTNKNNIN